MWKTPHCPRGQSVPATYSYSDHTSRFLSGHVTLESIVASGHKKIWRPPAANMGFCEFKDVVAFGNNQLWRPLAAKA